MISLSSAKLNDGVILAFFSEKIKPGYFRIVEKFDNRLISLDFSEILYVIDFIEEFWIFTKIALNLNDNDSHLHLVSH